MKRSPVCTALKNEIALSTTAILAHNIFVYGAYSQSIMSVIGSIVRLRLASLGIYLLRCYFGISRRSNEQSRTYGKENLFDMQD